MLVSGCITQSGDGYTSWQKDLCPEICVVNAMEISMEVFALRCHLLVHLKLAFEPTGIQSPNIFSFFYKFFCVFVGRCQEHKRQKWEPNASVRLLTYASSTEFTNSGRGQSLLWQQKRNIQWVRTSWTCWCLQKSCDNICTFVRRIN